MKTEIRHGSYLYPSPLLRELQILELLDENPYLSQAAVAQEVELAVAMVNKYITSFYNEGYIEKEAYLENRYVYKLTLKGKKKMQYHLFSFTAELIKLYSTVKERILIALEQVIPGQESNVRIALYGAGEVAEVVFNTLMEMENIEIAGVIDDSLEKQKKVFYSFPIQSPGKLEEINPDVILITSWFHAHDMLLRIEDLYGDRYKTVSLNTWEGEAIENRG